MWRFVHEICKIQEAADTILVVRTNRDEFNWNIGSKPYRVLNVNALHEHKNSKVMTSQIRLLLYGHSDIPREA